MKLTNDTYILRVGVEDSYGVSATIVFENFTQECVESLLFEYKALHPKSDVGHLYTWLRANHAFTRDQELLLILN